MNFNKTSWLYLWDKSGFGHLDSVFKVKSWVWGGGGGGGGVVNVLVAEYSAINPIKNPRGIAFYKMGHYLEPRV